MDLDVEKGAFMLREPVHVARVAVHVPVRVWSISVGEKVHGLVDRPPVNREAVPEYGGSFRVCLGVRIWLWMKTEKLVRSPEKGGWHALEHPIPVVLLGVELDGEA